ncbi:ABC transporter ATP-binding protein [Paenibacillus sp. JX-17]|uniref:ABC transporter ATP-binding protein n=1 Tax=Paenibacillus lacisoli TaxID=3064525 RepID=A0ABT9CDN1_9BACL|nr:ABC transporter ATP-binding protein [Paenibacillus sp. JX-17]MDO7906970.1 ABC transporter ATP-binding protein [Paenibacillus sp. JX-17]
MTNMSHIQSAPNRIAVHKASAAAEPLLEVTGLSKSYGRKQALQNVSFTLKEGSSFGFLGPNGAGKSTTMKILTGVVKPDQGSVKLFGEEIDSNPGAASRYIGYVPQEITLYERLSAWDNLEFFGQAYGVRGAELRKRMKEVLEQTGLLDRAKEEIRTFSGGMKRRINIAAALLHRPQLLIMDEPTVGIDPQSRNHIFDLIRGLNRDGVTVIYSTHYMEEVEALCDEVAIMDQGMVKAQAPLGELLGRYASQAIYIEAAGMPKPQIAPGITSVRKEGSGWVLETEQAEHMIKLLITECSKHNWNVKKLEVIRPSLEDVFLTVTGTALRD